MLYPGVVLGVAPPPRWFNLVLVQAQVQVDLAAVQVLRQVANSDAEGECFLNVYNVMP